MAMRAGERCGMLQEENLRARGFLLLCEERAEHGFLDIRFSRAVGGVDERVGAAVSEFCVSLVHAVLRGMVAEQYVARQRTHELERAVELGSSLVRYRCRWTQAAADHHVIVLPAL